MNGIVKIVAPLALIAASLPAFAQTPMSVNARLHRQNARIAAGVHNHDLNKYQAHALHTRDARIHVAERRDRLHDNGHLTTAERARLQHRLNHTSTTIYNRKHY